MTRLENNYFLSDADFYINFRNCDVRENLSVMYTNAQSCANMKTFDEIKCFIMECQCNIDVIVITETWFKKTELMLYNIDGYVANHSCRNDRRGGGVSIYVRSPIQIVNCEMIEAEINLVCVDIVNCKLNKVRIIGAYRPPNAANYRTYMRALDKIINEKTIINTFVVGDMNINVSNSGQIIDNNVTYRDYMTHMKSNGLQLCNTSVTRENSGTIIDHFFSTVTDRLDHKIDTIRNTFSDHNIIVSRIRCADILVSNREQRRKINYPELNELIATKLLNEMPNCEDVDTQYNFLIDTIVASIEEATTRYTVNTKKIKMCEWLEACPNVLVLINQKKKICGKNIRIITERIRTTTKCRGS